MLPWVLLLIISLGAVYWWLVRPVLRQKAEMSEFFDKWDLERAGFIARLKMGLAGLKTTLWSKFLIIAGLFVPVLSAVGDFDLSTVLPPFTIPWTSIVVAPTQYVPAFVVPLIGWITLKLRELTQAPIGVPSPAQVQTIMPDAPPAAIEAKVAEIAVVKAGEAQLADPKPPEPPFVAAKD